MTYGFQYYEHLLAYVDDIHALSRDPQKIHFILCGFYHLKGRYDKPAHYSGAQEKHGFSR